MYTFYWRINPLRCQCANKVNYNIFTSMVRGGGDYSTRFMRKSTFYISPDVLNVVGYIESDSKEKVGKQIF